MLAWGVSQVKLVVKKLPANTEHSNPWVWKNPLEEGMATSLQYSCLENPMDRKTWQATHP